MSDAAQTPVEVSALSPEELDAFTTKLIIALKTVFDPEIPVDIYELGLIYKVDVADNKDVTVDMTLTAPNCPVAGGLLHQLLGFHSLADLVSHAHGGIQRRTAQQHGEFLAAIAGGGVAALEVFGQAGGNQLQNLVAGLVAPAVIEFLEVINVAHQQRHRLVRFGHGGHGIAHSIVKRLAVGDVGQGIGKALFAHIGQLAAQLADLFG